MRPLRERHDRSLTGLGSRPASCRPVPAATRETEGSRFGKTCFVKAVCLVAAGVGFCTQREERPPGADQEIAKRESGVTTNRGGDTASVLPRLPVDCGEWQWLGTKKGRLQDRSGLAANRLVPSRQQPCRGRNRASGGPITTTEEIERRTTDQESSAKAGQAHAPMLAHEITCW